jgi:alpha-tubulin suppressor-like RCC1 family protein
MYLERNRRSEITAARFGASKSTAGTIWLAAVWLQLSTAACEPAVDDLSSSDSAAVELDADAEQSDASDSGAEASSTEDAEAGAAACRTNADCPDDLACNDDGVCGEFTPMTCASPCTADHPCDPRSGTCRCDKPGFDPDADGDEELAEACGGTDCNDHDFFVKRRATEICDPRRPETLSRDEDCDPAIFFHTDAAGVVPADQDEDGYISSACVNVGPDGEEYRGDDCNDGSPNIHPNQTESCDELDNNCNNMIDELEIETSAGVETKPLGLRAAAYPDADRDGHGDKHAKPDYFCKSFGSYPGYVFEEEPTDPDDAASSVFAGAPEICDGEDNDGNGMTDASDPDIALPYNIPLTTFTCDAGSWTISRCPSDDVGWCGGPIADGCSTDMTRLDSCRACTTDCKFACGGRGCAEVKKLALGYEHSCALTTDGQVACWGASSFGRLGRDASTDFAVARLNPRVTDVHDIAAGAQHTCAILGKDRELWCWGSNEFGQLGAGVQSAPLQTFTAAAVRVEALDGSAGMTGVSVVDASKSHTCAVLAAGDLLCFGLQTDGRLGNLQTGEAIGGVRRAFRNERAYVVPSSGATVIVGDRVTDIAGVSLGEKHGCSLTKTGTVECWGDNTYGQLGEIELPNSASLRAVTGLPTPVKAVSAGRYHTCALTPDGVYCWGMDTFGRLGNRGDKAGRGPAKVVGVDDAVEVGAGFQSTCVRRSNGAVICWGDDAAGELGPNDGASFSGLLPTLNSQGSEFAFLAVGDQHSCAIRADGQVLCWGANGYGQLGAGTASQDSPGSLRSLLPVQNPTR